MCLDKDVTKQSIVYYLARSAPFEPFMFSLTSLYQILSLFTTHAIEASLCYKSLVLPLNSKPRQQDFSKVPCLHSEWLFQSLLAKTTPQRWQVIGTRNLLQVYSLFSTSSHQRSTEEGTTMPLIQAAGCGLVIMTKVTGVLLNPILTWKLKLS